VCVCVCVCTNKLLLAVDDGCGDRLMSCSEYGRLLMVWEHRGGFLFIEFAGC
jgi:hypothetical protein